MSIQPEGEELRNAVRWITEELKYGEEKKISVLVGKAGLKFDLSPKDENYLSNLFREKQGNSR